MPYEQFGELTELTPAEVFLVDADRGQDLSPGGTKLIEMGKQGRQFFVLIDGIVNIRRGDRKIAEMRAGSIFGEIALLTDAPRTATVTATNPVRVLVITGQAFQRVLNETTTIRPKVLAAPAERAGATSS